MTANSETTRPIAPSSNVLLTCEKSDPRNENSNQPANTASATNTSIGNRDGGIADKDRPNNTLGAATKDDMNNVPKTPNSVSAMVSQPSAVMCLIDFKKAASQCHVPSDRMPDGTLADRELAAMISKQDCKPLPLVSLLPVNGRTGLQFSEITFRDGR